MFIYLYYFVNKSGIVTNASQRNRIGKDELVLCRARLTSSSTAGLLLRVRLTTLRVSRRREEFIAGQSPYISFVLCTCAYRDFFFPAIFTSALVCLFFPTIDWPI